MALILSLTACAKNELYVGYNFPDNYQERLKIGRTSKSDVLEFMGSPTTESSYGESTFYYIAQKQISKSFFQPKIEQQDVVALTFNSKGILTQAKHYDMNDYKAMQLDETRTTLKGNEMGMLEQMMHNVGRFGGGKTKAPGS